MYKYTQRHSPRKITKNTRKKQKKQQTTKANMRKSDNAVNEGGDWRILCNVTVDNVFYELPNLFFPLVHFPIAPHLATGSEFTIFLCEFW